MKKPEHKRSHFNEWVGDQYDSDESTQLNELHVNLLGKLFLTALAAWVVGKATNLKLRGTKQELTAISNVLQSSRRFQDELSKPGATIQSVMDKLNVKNMDARTFERVFGVKWPL